LDRPTSGSIVIDGKAMEGLNSEERTQVRLFELGYIFQDYALVPTLSAIENVMVPLLMQGKDNALAVQSATDALTRVGLSDKLSNLPSQLSGGQQQRVSIARAIAHKPKIIFADEPTANLDSESSEMIIDVFKKLNQEGQTIVMVTHEMEYAEKTHRIIRLSDGVIISDEMNKKGKLSNTKTA
jgi:putative ABC transport system ATP-binding protein